MNELKNKRGGKMQIEFQILDALQKIHTPVLDGVMCLITSLGNAGIIWILLTIALLINPKIRRTKEGADFSGNPADEADVFCLQH